MPYPVSATQQHSRCALCKKISMRDTIQLRTGYVCASCVSVKESRLGQICVQIIKLKQERPPSNIWGNVGVAIGVTFTVLCVLAVFIHYSLAFFLGFIAVWLYQSTSRKSERTNMPFRKTIAAKINRLCLEELLIHRQLSHIYEQYLGVPPDWLSRRAKIIERDGKCCRHCGRRMSGSRVPFHVHHVIPKAQRDGSHKLKNLILLCELCHSKIKEYGHDFIGRTRRKRLERRRVHTCGVGA